MKTRLVLVLLAFAWAGAMIYAADQPNGADDSAIYSTDAQNSVLLKRVWRSLCALGPTDHIAYSQIVATTAGTATLPARAVRMRLVLSNPWTETVWVSNVSPATMANGFPIVGGTASTETYTGAFYFFSASGASTIYAKEVWNQ